MIINIDKQKELLFQYKQGGEKRFKQLLKITKGSEIIALSKYKKELLTSRQLHNDLTIEDFQEDFKKRNKDKLKKDFEMLDLIYRTEDEIDDIIHTIVENQIKIESLYKEFENGATFNFTQLIYR